MDQQTLQTEVARRRTFAIISHPDAGKTTLTEKILLYCGAIHLAGAVKQRRARRYTTSDWMDLERERGISVSTSAMQVEYHGHRLNLLDTPGHNDFSEDTYRTLTAVDAALMLIDAAKGVESQTRKLFEVCRMRGIPIVTFINKLDRDGREPVELLHEIEQVLQIPCSAVTWPLGGGHEFRGVYDRWGRQFLRFEKVGAGAERAVMQVAGAQDQRLRDALGARVHEQLLDELTLLETAGNRFDHASFRAGKLTPVFFGSALTNFGVEPFLQRFLELAPPPSARRAAGGRAVPADDDHFSAFVFKIQANMDARHRDRVAFLRICSGRMAPHMDVRIARSGESLRMDRPLQFFARERTAIDEAVSGDVIGLWDSGKLRIGDTLCEGAPFAFDGIPRFSPEHFARARLRDPLKHKQLEKGLHQLCEEGAALIFTQPGAAGHLAIVGVVGALQLEVIEYRLKHEYAVDVSFDVLPYQVARWTRGEMPSSHWFDRYGGVMRLVDAEQRPVILLDSEWTADRIERDNGRLRLLKVADLDAATSHSDC